MQDRRILPAGNPHQFRVRAGAARSVKNRDIFRFMNNHCQQRDFLVPRLDAMKLPDGNLCYHEDVGKAAGFVRLVSPDPIVEVCA